LVPAEYEIIETDITAEIEAQAAKKAAKQAARERLKALDKSKTPTVAQLWAIVKDILEKDE
jgi:hypothetical protein